MPLVISTPRNRSLTLCAGAVISLAAANVGHTPRLAKVATLTVSREIKTGTPDTIKFRGIFAGGAGRLDLIVAAEHFPPGAYILVSDTSGAALIVVPGDKAYQVMGAGARLGGIVEAYTPEGTVTNLTVRLDSLGPGEVIEGRPTRRYRITSQFNLTTGEGVAVSRSVTDLWQAELDSKIPNPFVGLGGDPSPTDPLQKLNAALRSLHLPGVTIKSETAATLSTQGVVFTNQLSTMRLSDIRDTTVDDATLAVPVGFSSKDH